MAWAFAARDYCHGPLRDAISAEALARIAHLEPLDLCRIVWACAPLAILDGPLLAAISAASRRTSAATPQDMSKTAWAMSTLAVKDAPLLNAISSAALRMLSEFDLLQLANTAWAFSSSR